MAWLLMLEVNLVPITLRRVHGDLNSWTSRLGRGAVDDRRAVVEPTTPTLTARQRIRTGRRCRTRAQQSSRSALRRRQNDQKRNPPLRQHSRASPAHRVPCPTESAGFGDVTAGFDVESVAMTPFGRSLQPQVGQRDELPLEVKLVQEVLAPVGRRVGHFESVQ